LQLKTYAFGFSELIFDQINESFSLFGEVICNEKRKQEVFLNVKKVTKCKQLKGDRVKR